MTHYDLICIGGGSGGLAAAKKAASYGAKVLVVEAKKLGGTCVNVGCVPKKICWHAAQINDFIELSADYGFDKTQPKLNWGHFTQKRDAFIAKLNGIYEDGLNDSKVELVFGHAKFVDSQTVEVESKTYTANKIIVAVGGKAIIPEIPGSELGIDSDGFFGLQDLPKSIAIVGAGYIAVEIAGLLNAFGVDTHLIVRKNRFLKQSDADIVRALDQQMQADGIHIHYETQITAVKQSGDQLMLELTDDKNLQVETLLWAIGRTPLTKEIRLDKTKVKQLPNGNIETDDWQNTSDPSVYALGDITGQPTLTPAAIEAGRKLADRLFGGKTDARADFTYVPTVIFSHPGIGSVGMTEDMVKENYTPDQIKVYQSQFNPLLRAMSDHKVPTVMKVICVGDEEKIVGIHLLGDFVDEIIQGFAVAVQMGACKADLDKTLAIHPTSGEELVTLT